MTDPLPRATPAPPPDSSLQRSRQSADQDFGARPVGGGTEPCPPRALKGRMVELTWGGGIKVSRRNGHSRDTVPAPHWREGEAVEEGPGSLRPAVLLTGGRSGTGQLSAKVNITDNRGVSGSAVLRGTLDAALVMEGSCPTAVGEHTVSLTVAEMPLVLRHHQGDVTWTLTHPDACVGSIDLANPTRLEVFVILDPPAACFNPPGVWVEALRFLFNEVHLNDFRRPSDVAARIAWHCHGQQSLRYDTQGGAPVYGCSMDGSGRFDLSSYLISAKPVVNCYDQAAGVQVFSGAVGVLVQWLFLEPFGYINTTDLIGVGACNSPFFASTRPPGPGPALVDINDPRRTAFGNHAFTSLAGKLLDACAGPHVGTETKDAYVAASIDHVTTLYAGFAPPYNQPGRADRIADGGGVRALV